MFGIRAKTGHKYTAEDLRTGKTIAYGVPSRLSLAMQLDTSRGQLSEKGFAHRRHNVLSLNLSLFVEGRSGQNP
jgi:hypothetical protein